MDKTAVLKKTELFGQLSDSELKALSNACVERRLKKGESLFNAGEDSKGLYVLAEGFVRAFRVNSEGREQIIHVERAVTTIAEITVFDDKPYPSTVVAAEETAVLFISKADVQRLFTAHPSIALAALRLLASRLRKTAALAESLALRDVHQRLAAFLLNEFKARRLKTWKLPTNSVIAARLGSVREVVSRVFAKLEEEKLISVDKNHNARILDEDGLKKLAGEQGL